MVSTLAIKKTQGDFRCLVSLVQFLLCYEFISAHELRERTNRNIMIFYGIFEAASWQTGAIALY